MLFNEIYGSYYRVTALALREAVKGDLTRKRLNDLIRNEAFSESVLALPQGLQGENWRLLRRALTTPVQAEPTVPLTLMQKRWLKALLLDPRIQLFDPDTTGLEDVSPLFTPDMFVWYDRYANGDDYTDPAYAARFRVILQAIRERRRLSMTYDSRRRGQIQTIVTPHHLEYSQKDDRFRLIASNWGRNWTINLSGITTCEIGDEEDLAPYHRGKTSRLTFELVDRRNALERVLLHFSHLEKETERLDDERYRVILHYDPQDETEMVIRILSFGPVIHVVEPLRFAEQVRQRVERQMTLAPFLLGPDRGKMVE